MPSLCVVVVVLVEIVRSDLADWGNLLRLWEVENCIYGWYTRVKVKAECQTTLLRLNHQNKNNSITYMEIHHKLTQECDN